MTSALSSMSLQHIGGKNKGNTSVMIAVKQIICTCVWLWLRCRVGVGGVDIQADTELLSSGADERRYLAGYYRYLVAHVGRVAGYVDHLNSQP